MIESDTTNEEAGPGEGSKMSVLGRLVMSGDVSLFYWLNQGLQSVSMSIVMRAITHLGSTSLSVVLPAAMMMSPGRSLARSGQELALTLIISQVLVHAIKRVVKRPRPFLTLKYVITIKPPLCPSFPSGHTAAAFSLAFVLATLLSGWATVFMVGAGLVGISRVYLGFHYPSDVLFGVLIAYLSFALATLSLATLVI